MNRFLKILLAVVVTSLSSVSALKAQTLEGEVVRNPDDTVTYTIDLDGPPNGSARFYVGAWLFSPPLISPSLGPLWLDPVLLFPLTPFLPLDASGQTRLEFILTPDVLPGIPLPFQTFNIDTLGILRFSNNALVMTHNQFQTPCPFDYVFRYDTGQQNTVSDNTLCLDGSGPPGATVEVQVIEDQGVRFADQTPIDAQGEYSLVTNVPNGLVHGDLLQINCDNNPVEVLNLFQP